MYEFPPVSLKVWPSAEGQRLAEARAAAVEVAVPAVWLAALETEVEDCWMTERVEVTPLLRW